jgi:HrpA-like RNA helicase
LKELGVLDASGNITGTGLCVYRLNMDVPVALFLIGCRKHAVDKQKALTLAAIMLVDRSYQGWFRPPMRTLPDYSEQMKKYETLQSKYTSDVSELLALYELYEDFANDRLSRWKKWINVKHLSEVPKTVRQIEKNYNSMEEKCMEELPKASPGGKFLVPKTPAETIVQCLLYGFKNQIAVLKSKQKPIYKFEVMGETIEVAPEEGNGLSEFTTRVIYFDLSNILGRRQLSGLTNIADD